MQFLLSLPNDTIRELLEQPDPEQFARQAIQNALHHAKPEPSKWVKLAQSVKENPIDLGDYTGKFKKDMQEFRENFSFEHDAS